MKLSKGKVYKCVRPYSPNYIYTYREIQETEIGSLWLVEDIDIHRDTVHLKPLSENSNIKYINIHMAYMWLHFSEVDGTGETEGNHDKGKT